MKPAVYDQTTAEIEGARRAPAPAACTAARQRARAPVRRVARGVRRRRATSPEPTRPKGARRSRARRQAVEGATRRRRRAPGDGANGAGAIPAESRRRDPPRADRGRSAHARGPRRASSPSRSSRSRRRATPKARSCASSRTAASGGPSTYAEIISKVQARDYVEKVDGGRAVPADDARQVRRRRAGAERARLHGPGVHVDDGGGARRRRGRAPRTASRSCRASTRASARSSTPARRASGGTPSPSRPTRVCEACGVGQDEQALVEERVVPRLRELPEVQEHARPRARRQRPACGRAPRETGIVCDKCGKPMVIRAGRYGEFLSCTGYPSCKNARPVPLGVPCPKCGGDLIEIRPKKRGGRTFYGCSNYNNEKIKCDFKLWQKPIAEPCPLCKAHVPRLRRDEGQADDRVREQGMRLQEAHRVRGGRGGGRGDARLGGAAPERGAGRLCGPLSRGSRL